MGFFGSKENKKQLTVHQQRDLLVQKCADYKEHLRLHIEKLVSDDHERIKYDSVPDQPFNVEAFIKAHTASSGICSGTFWLYDEWPKKNPSLNAAIDKFLIVKEMMSTLSDFTVYPLDKISENGKNLEDPEFCLQYNDKGKLIPLPDTMFFGYDPTDFSHLAGPFTGSKPLSSYDEALDQRKLLEYTRTTSSTPTFKLTTDDMSELIGKREETEVAIKNRFSALNALLDRKQSNLTEHRSNENALWRKFILLMKAILGIKRTSGEALIQDIEQIVPKEPKI